MQNHPAGQPQGKPARARLRLPFEKRKFDIATWSYVHRAGLLNTVIVMLLLAIFFVAAKIDMGGTQARGAIIIEFAEEYEVLPEEAQRPDEGRYDDFSDVSNRQSNENAELDASLRDDRGRRANDLYDDAAQLDAKMRANRQAYEDGLRSEQELIDAARRNTPTDNRPQGKEGDTRVKGRVTVSFSLKNPVRTKDYLEVPAYKCEGGGEVTVNITVDNNGFVVAAALDKARSSSDPCLQTEALNAARNSRFNVNTSAPAKQKGAIYYIFMPQ